MMTEVNHRLLNPKKINFYLTDTSALDRTFCLNLTCSFVCFCLLVFKCVPISIAMNTVSNSILIGEIILDAVGRATYLHVCLHQNLEQEVGQGFAGEDTDFF